MKRKYVTISFQKFLCVYEQQFIQNYKQVYDRSPHHAHKPVCSASVAIKLSRKRNIRVDFTHVSFCFVKSRFVCVLMSCISGLQNITTQKTVLLTDTTAETSKSAIFFKVVRKYYLNRSCVNLEYQLSYIISGP